MLENGQIYFYNLANTVSFNVVIRVLLFQIDFFNFKFQKDFTYFAICTSDGESQMAH